MIHFSFLFVSIIFILTDLETLKSFLCNLSQVIFLLFYTILTIHLGLSYFPHDIYTYALSY
jgi:glycerol-3-phosphate responsive antiterminator